MAFFAKSRRKLRTKNFEAHFHRKLRTLGKCSNVKKLRTTEPQPVFTGSYKKKRVYLQMEENLGALESLLCLLLVWDKNNYGKQSNDDGNWQESFRGESFREIDEIEFLWAICWRRNYGRGTASN